VSTAKSIEQLAFYATPTHECSYLPEREARTVFADPIYPKDTAIYSALVQNGFRRSGQHVYRPHCRNCGACIPVRLPVRDFAPRRRHRRAWQMNSGLEVRSRPMAFNEEHFELYHRYIRERHKGGGMDNPTPGQYMEFLTSPWAETIFYEFRRDRRLLAVAVADRLMDGLSAVYTFYEPEYGRFSLGMYAILWQIQEARRLDVDWLYLGYWIADSPKMAYKADFQPQERFQRGLWKRVNSQPPTDHKKPVEGEHRGWTKVATTEKHRG
jgi:arginine-tRNA-protein transferase